MQRSNPSAESKGLWYSAFPRFSPSAPRYGSPLILTTRSPRQVYNNCHLTKYLIRHYESKHQMEIMKYHRLIPVQMIRNIEIPPPFLRARLDPRWTSLGSHVSLGAFANAFRLRARGVPFGDETLRQHLFNHLAPGWAPTINPYECWLNPIHNPLLLDCWGVPLGLWYF